MAKWISGVRIGRNTVPYSNKRRIACTISLIAALLIMFLIVVLLGIFLWPAAKEPWTSFRLHPGIRPTHYDLHMFPKLYTDNESSFTANETIRINVGIATKHIILHSVAVKIPKSDIRNNTDNSQITIARTFFYKLNDYFVIETVDTIPENSSITLALQFSGHLNHNLRGFYKSNFTDKDTNATHFLASTKFEPNYARKTFPCFDEPSFKSYFSMNITHRPSHLALFNTMEKQTRQHPNEHEFVITEFPQTPVPMSTYLAAWVVVSGYSQINTTDSRNRLMRYYAPSYRITDAKNSAELGHQFRNYMDDLLNFTSPLNKVDMISIPQFKSGAMENWGLIMYRESKLLFNHKNDTEYVKYEVDRVVAHELAHTWFGNIVTMKWWNDIWLNEAFATYFAAICQIKFDQQWDIFGHLLQYNRRLMIKELNSSKPIIQPVTQNKQMKPMFNKFVYKKGAQLLFWLSHQMGNDNFMRGLQIYLKKYQYSSTVTKDLLSILNRQTNSINITAMMTPWLYQKGYPIIFVRYIERDNTLVVTQDSKFPNNKWYIPVQFLILNDTHTAEPSAIKTINSTTERVTFHLDPQFKTSDNAIVFNWDSYGYYRVRYDANLVNRLATQLETNFSTFTGLQRTILIDDALQLSELNYSDYQTSLQLINYISNDSNTFVWQLLGFRVVKMDYLVIDNACLRRFMTNATTTLFLSWNQSDNFPRKWNGHKFLIPCYFRNTECSRFVSKHFINWRNNNATHLDTNKLYKKYIYHYGLKLNDISTSWERLMTSYLETNDSCLLYGLMGTENAQNWRTLLNMLKVRDAFSSITTKFNFLVQSSRKLVWNWFKTACSSDGEFCKKHIKRLVPRVSYYFKTKHQLEEVSDLYKKHADSSIPELVLKRIEKNSKWVKKYSYSVERFFTCTK